MAQKSEPHPLLQRPLYVFDLPDEILQTLAIRRQFDDLTPALNDPSKPTHPSNQTEKKDVEEGGPSNATACSLCGLTFPNVQEQRDHIRSDLHGYNLKQKIKGLKPVGEAEFERLLEELDESISASESSEHEEEEDEDGAAKPKEDALSALLKRQAKLANENEHLSGSITKPATSRLPLIWFTTPALPDGTSLGIYRAIFTVAEQEEDGHIVDSLRRKQLTRNPARSSSTPKHGEEKQHSISSPHYFLCMIGGGHFAAMIVGLEPKVTKKHAGTDERQATVLAHKTFHRYTTRRKQGGSQSANDAAKGNAHSAGSSLRRYNEAALTNEIRELLAEWKNMIDTAELLFVRATGNTNRRTLFGPYDGQIMRPGDPRIRGFPFSTRRATQSELMRAFVELTRVKVSQISEDALSQANAAKSLSRQDTPQKPTKPKQLKEKVDETAVLHTTQLTSLIRRSKVPGVLSYLSSNSLSANFTFQPLSQHGHAPTALHLASSLNNSALVLALLTKAKADPTVLNDEGKTAFQLAGDRKTRDAFRVARSELGEAHCSWDTANVPAALSKSDFEKRQKRDEEERRAAETAESERRKIETERLRKESEMEEQQRKDKRFDKAGEGRILAPVKTASEKREEEGRGMSAEMRQRLERERRARAAEERIRRMQGAGTGNN